MIKVTVVNSSEYTLALMGWGVGWDDGQLKEEMWVADDQIQHSTHTHTHKHASTIYNITGSLFQHIYGSIDKHMRHRPTKRTWSISWVASMIECIIIEGHAYVMEGRLYEVLGTKMKRLRNQRLDVSETKAFVVRWCCLVSDVLGSDIRHTSRDRHRVMTIIGHVTLFVQNGFYRV